MIDAAKAIRDYLLSKPDLVALVGDRIYAEANTPDAGYTPAAGVCVCFRTRGGMPDYSGVLLTPSVQFKCYGMNEETAIACYRALYDAIECAAGATVRWARCEQLGVTLEEPDTGWVFVLGYFTMWVANP